VIRNGENGIVCFGSRKPLGSPFSQRLDAQPGGGIARQHLADADVFGQHLGRFVAGLAHDVTFADAVHRRLGDASCAQAMAAKGSGFKSELRGAFQYPADTVLVEAAAEDLAMMVDRAKGSSASDSGFPEPAAERAD